MVATLILVLLAASPDEDLRDDRPEEIKAEVIGPIRFHGEVSLLGAGAWSAIPSLGAGGGVHLEAGLVFDGAGVVSLRASFATAVVLFAMQFGVSYAHRIGDHVTLGIGATWGAGFGVVDMPGALSVQAPLRITYLFGAMKRRGLVIGAEVAPGIAYAGSRGYSIRAPGTPFTSPTPTASVMAQLTVGYAVW
ncbi:MAG: hypothetical protein QM817_24175 [Archangium sp.]